MAMKRSNRLRKEGGFVLITVYLLLATCLAYLVAMGNHAFAEMRASQRVELAGQSFYLAEAGVDRALQWLQQKRAPLPPLPFAGPQTLGVGTYTVTVTPFGDNLRYMIDSTGVAGFSQRHVRVIAQAESFSRYALFTNTEHFPPGPPLFGQAGWYTTGDHLDGPVHTNGQWNLAGRPIFDGLVTSVANSLNNAPGAAPVFNGGLTLGVPSIPLPAAISDTDLANAAGTTYRGNTQITLLADGTMRVTNAVAGLNNAVTAPPGNGVLYVDEGNVTLSGTLRGQMTIATNQDIRVTGNLLYARDPRDPVTPSPDLLGIVAGRDVVVDSTAPNNIQIDATMMALNGSFWAENWNSGLRGTMTVYGGIIEKYEGITGILGKGGLLVAGYHQIYSYDRRLQNLIPPLFPITGKYNPLGWEDKN